MNNIHALNSKSDETHSVENDFNVESSDLTDPHAPDEEGR